MKLVARSPDERQHQFFLDDEKDFVLLLEITMRGRRLEIKGHYIVHVVWFINEVESRVQREIVRIIFHNVFDPRFIR